MFRATAFLCLLVHAVSTLALEQKSPQTSRQLNSAWQIYLQDPNPDLAVMHFPYEHCFRKAASTHKVPLTLLLAVARGESDFNARAVSSANALGLMQILWPGTARHLGITRRRDLFEPCTNVDAGARYLKELLTRYKGNLHRSLAAYNYGPGRITVQGPAMPKGAQWYSGYIYRHLDYIRSAGTDKKQRETESTVTTTDYKTERKLALITFRTPYRATAFIHKLTRHPAEDGYKARLEWFRVSQRAFRVVLLYRSGTELERARQWLSGAGFGRI